MPAVTIRNLPEDTHRALKARAARNNRSAEAEIRAILEDAVNPQDRLKLGTAMSTIGRAHGVTKADIDAINPARAKRPAKPMDFK